MNPGGRGQIPQRQEKKRQGGGQTVKTRWHFPIILVYADLSIGSGAFDFLKQVGFDTPGVFGNLFFDIAGAVIFEIGQMIGMGGVGMQAGNKFGVMLLGQVVKNYI